MPASINTRYTPGGVVTETDSQVGYNPGSLPSFLPNSPQLPGLQDFSGAINARLAIEAERERRAAQLHRLQLEAMGQQMRDADRPQSYRSGSSPADQAQRLQLEAMKMSALGDPVFLKPMNGFNASGGYARASAGDPGAAFSGYSQGNPASAYLQERAMQPRQSEPWDAYQTQRRRSPQASE